MRRTLATVVSALVALAAASPAAAVTFSDGHGLHVVSAQQSGRLVRMQVSTAALPKPANVDVLLPPSYDTQPRRRYPVVYLMHGASGTAGDWIDHGHSDAVIGDRQLIAVMPDITLGRANSGWCTDWPGGAQRWETFHIDQLLPWIDANLRTIRSRSMRAIAGLSEGGACSLGYAARHPDLFGSAFGYSGVVETWYDAHVRAGASALVTAFEAQDGLAPGTVYGDPVTDAINWEAHDPATLAENLRWTHLHMFWGDGTPGPFDTPTTYPGNNWGGEKLADVDNQAFRSRLQDLGIPARYSDYGPGTHTWPYWARDLKETLADVDAAFAQPSPNPSRFNYTSGDESYAVYGWTVKMTGAARALSTLVQDGQRRFELTGSGTADLSTPRFFKPRTGYEVTIAPDGGAPVTTSLRADASGRLRLHVPLGQSSPRTTTVTIAPYRRTAKRVPSSGPSSSR